MPLGGPSTPFISSHIILSDCLFIFGFNRSIDRSVVVIIVVQKGMMQNKQQRNSNNNRVWVHADRK
jgi:hypothetical protein